MKKFLLTVFSVLLLTGLILIGTYYLGSVTQRNKLNFKLPDDRNILLVGNSVGEFAINDSILSNWANRCFSGQSFLQTSPYLRIALNANAAVDTVVITVDAHTMTGYSDKLFADRELGYLKANKSRIIISDQEELDDYKLNKNFPLTYYLSTGFDLLFRKDKEEGSRFQKLYRNALSKDLSAHYQQLKTGGGKFKSSDEIIKQSSLQVKYLNKMIAECRKHKVACVLMSLPFYRIDEFYDREGFKDFLSTLDTTVLIADYSDLVMPDTTYFSDVIHLNYKGADYISNHIKTNGLKTKKIKEYLQDSSQNIEQN